jgi:L-fucose mutarotase
MPKNLDPLLTPGLLYVLRAMGHDEELVLADCNFPSKQAYAVVSTSERRPYGCFIPVKGVIGPDGKIMRQRLTNYR